MFRPLSLVCHVGVMLNLSECYWTVQGLESNFFLQHLYYRINTCVHILGTEKVTVHTVDVLRNVRDYLDMHIPLAAYVSYEDPRITKHQANMHGLLPETLDSFCMPKWEAWPNIGDQIMAAWTDRGSDFARLLYRAGIVVYSARFHKTCFQKAFSSNFEGFGKFFILLTGCCVLASLEPWTKDMLPTLPWCGPAPKAADALHMRMKWHRVASQVLLSKNTDMLQTTYPDLFVNAAQILQPYCYFSALPPSCAHAAIQQIVGSDHTVLSLYYNSICQLYDKDIVMPLCARLIANPLLYIKEKIPTIKDKTASHSWVSGKVRRQNHGTENRWTMASGIPRSISLMANLGRACFDKLGMPPVMAEFFHWLVQCRFLRSADITAALHEVGDDKNTKCFLKLVCSSWFRRLYICIHKVPELHPDEYPALWNIDVKRPCIISFCFHCGLPSVLPSPATNPTSKPSKERARCVLMLDTNKRRQIAICTMCCLPCTQIDLTGNIIRCYVGVRDKTMSWCGACPCCGQFCVLAEQNRIGPRIMCCTCAKSLTAQLNQDPFHADKSWRCYHHNHVMAACESVFSFQAYSSDGQVSTFHSCIQHRPNIGPSTIESIDDIRFIEDSST